MLKNTTAMALVATLMTWSAMTNAQTTTAPANTQTTTAPTSTQTTTAPASSTSSNIPASDLATVVENVLGPDARIFDVKNRNGTVKIEALQGDSKVEMIVDPATGDLIKMGRETIGSARDRQEYEQKAASQMSMMDHEGHGLGDGGGHGDDNGDNGAEDHHSSASNGLTGMGSSTHSDDGMTSNDDHGGNGDDHGSAGMGSDGGMGSGGGDHDGGDHDD